MLLEELKKQQELVSSIKFFFAVIALSALTLLVGWQEGHPL